MVSGKGQDGLNRVDGVLTALSAGAAAGSTTITFISITKDVSLRDDKLERTWLLWVVVATANWLNKRKRWWKRRMKRKRSER